MKSSQSQGFGACVLQDSYVTIECTIPQKYHRTVVGLKGQKVQDVCREFNVNIKFPDRPRPNNGGMCI